MDVQRAFVTGASAVPGAATLLAAVHRLLERAHAAGAPVIHLQNDGAPGTPDQPGTSGWELAVPPKPTDIVIRKSTDDGFADTELEELLRERGADRVAFCGMLSEMCLAATVRTAMARSFRAVLAHDSQVTFHPRTGTC